MSNERSKQTRAILWRNVQTLMRAKFDGAENLNRLARETGIGPGTASRIKDMETDVGIGVLAKIAARYEIAPHELLSPHFSMQAPEETPASRTVPSVVHDALLSQVVAAWPALSHDVMHAIALIAREFSQRSPANADTSRALQDMVNTPDLFEMSGLKKTDR